MNRDQIYEYLLKRFAQFADRDEKSEAYVEFDAVCWTASEYLSERACGEQKKV